MTPADATLPPLLYDLPHRGLRWVLGRTLERAGSTDYDDPEALAELTRSLKELCALTERHMRHEEQFLHEALRARGSFAYLTLEEEHAEHRAELAHLTRSLQGLEHSPDRAAAGHGLYLAVARFVAGSLEHMEHEEGSAQATFERLYAPAELHELHDRLLQAIPLDEMIAFFKVILPAVPPRERLALLAGSQSSLPPALFQGFVAGAVSYLTAGEQKPLLSFAADAP